MGNVITTASILSDRRHWPIFFAGKIERFSSMPVSFLLAVRGYSKE
ncbi:TPA: hypothetical protein ACPY9J_002294 [Yersinia enterocolitica]